jgi:hypothetical protein
MSPDGMDRGDLFEPASIYPGGEGGRETRKVRRHFVDDRHAGQSHRDRRKRISRPVDNAQCLLGKLEELIGRETHGFRHGQTQSCSARRLLTSRGIQSGSLGKTCPRSMTLIRGQHGFSGQDAIIANRY